MVWFLNEIIRVTLPFLVAKSPGDGCETYDFNHPFGGWSYFATIHSLFRSKARITVFFRIVLRWFFKPLMATPCRLYPLVMTIVQSLEPWPSRFIAVREFPSWIFPWWIFPWWFLNVYQRIYHWSSPFFMRKSPLFIGKSPLFMGKSPLYIGKSPCFHGKLWLLEFQTVLAIDQL